MFIVHHNRMAVDALALCYVDDGNEYTMMTASPCHAMPYHYLIVVHIFDLDIYWQQNATTKRRDAHE